MFKEYNIEVVRIFKSAEDYQKSFNHEYVGTEHLLLALLNESRDISEYLKKFNLTFENFYNKVNYLLNNIDNKKEKGTYTPLLKRIIYNSSSNMCAENLLFNMLAEGEGVAIRLLLDMNIDVDIIYNHYKKIINGENTNEIDKIAKCLNNEDLNEKTIGREKEINLIIETLLRKKKNNPILIGEAGVGKTAIVEELARKIELKQVPKELLDNKIYSLEMGSLVAGTKYRGEFEERLKNIINDVINYKNIILFIDEIHSMVNAGAAEGAISAADILKPYLAREQIKCIGATTNKEYEKYIQKDKALSRRFEPIIVKEPTENETIEILKQIKEEYINYHNVNVSDEIIEIIVHLSNIYFPNKKNPDKSIELLDSVMAYVNMNKKNELIEKEERELEQLKLEKIRYLEKEQFSEALKVNIKEKQYQKKLNNIINNNRINVKKEDILNLLEMKNNIITNNKSLNLDYCNKEDKTKLKELLKERTRPIIINVHGDSKKIIDDLDNNLKYQKFKWSNSTDFKKIINALKYYPSSVIKITNEIINSKLFKQIYQDGMYENEDDIINFNQVIFINNIKAEKSFGILKNDFKTDLNIFIKT